MSLSFWNWDTPDSTFPILRLPWNTHGNTTYLLKKITNATQVYIFIGTVSFWSDIMIWGTVQVYRTEIVARWRKPFIGRAGSSVLLWNEFTYTLQAFSGDVRSGNLYLIFKLLPSVFLWCLNSKIVFVYLLIVVTAAAIQQAKEAHARL